MTDHGLPYHHQHQYRNRTGHGTLLVLTDEVLTDIMDSTFDKRVPSSSPSSNDKPPRLGSSAEVISFYNRLLRSQSHSRHIIRSSDPGFSAEEQRTSVWESIWNKDLTHIFFEYIPRFPAID